MLKKIEKSEERSGGRKKIKTLKKRENHDDLTLSFILDLLRGRLRGPPEDTVARRKASLERRAGSASGQAAKGGVVKCWERRRCIIDSVCLWPRRGRAAAVPRSHALRAYARGCPAAGKGDEKRVEKRNRSKKSKFPPCFGPAPRSISLNLLDLFSLSLSLKKKKKNKGRCPRQVPRPLPAGRLRRQRAPRRRQAEACGQGRGGGSRARERERRRQRWRRKRRQRQRQRRQLRLRPPSKQRRAGLLLRGQGGPGSRGRAQPVAQEEQRL